MKPLFHLLKKIYFHGNYLYYCTSMHVACHYQKHFKAILCIFLSTKWHQILLYYSHATGQQTLTFIPDSWLGIQTACLFTYNIACTEINIQVILRTQIPYCSAIVASFSSLTALRTSALCLSIEMLSVEARSWRSLRFSLLSSPCARNADTKLPYASNSEKMQNKPTYTLFPL